MMRTSHRMRVEDPSQVGEARRLAASMGRAASLDEVRTEHLCIVVSELGNNLLRHAGGGALVLRFLPIGEGVEVLSLDNGPGIGDVADSLRNGYSTLGGAGTGLGAIRRLSNLFDIHSKPGLGTAVLSRVGHLPSPPPPRPPLLDVGAVCLPVSTEEHCGDAWVLYQAPDRALLMVADGLGHGPFAAEASTLAARVFEKHPEERPAQMIERMHRALGNTRGAAVAVVEVHRTRHTVTLCGVGNISGRVIAGDTSWSMVSHYGIVGVGQPRAEEFSGVWPQRDGLLVMHSDGVSTHWSMEEHPGLQGRSAGLIAGVLFRDHGRPRDDSVVVVLKETRSSR